MVRFDASDSRDVHSLSMRLLAMGGGGLTIGVCNCWCGDVYTRIHLSVLWDIPDIVWGVGRAENVRNSARIDPRGHERLSIRASWDFGALCPRGAKTPRRRRIPMPPPLTRATGSGARRFSSQICHVACGGGEQRALWRGGSTRPAVPVPAGILHPFASGGQIPLTPGLKRPSSA